MSLVRSIGVVVATVLLTVTLVSANGLAVAHLTVLDPGFVTETLEEEDGYALIEDAVVASMNQSAGGTDGESLVDQQAVVEQAVTEAYLENQTEANVHRTYAYLHGNAETVNLSVEMDPLVANVGDAVEAQVENTSTAALLRAQGSASDGPVDAEMVARLTANESSYRETKTDFRAQIRERVLDDAVDRAFNSSSNDELLALVIEDYDPRDYSESEKERMVADREPEIRAALRERIERERGDEIDAAVQDQLSQIREEAGTVPQSGTDTERAAARLQATIVRGLTTDVTYDRFQSNLSAAKSDLATAIGDRAAASMDEQMPARIDISENMGEGAQRGFQQARSVVGVLDVLAFVVPVLVLGLLGGVYAITRSAVDVARSLGWGLFWAGLPAFVVVWFARSRLESLVADLGLPSGPGTDLLVGFLGQMLGLAGAVSLTMAVAGALSIAAVLAVRRGLVDQARRELAQRR